MATPFRVEETLIAIGIGEGEALSREADCRHALIQRLVQGKDVVAGFALPCRSSGSG